MTQQKTTKDNSGYLFPNRNKSTEKQPDYRGKLTHNGKEWLVSGWKRMKDGEEMISISLTDPDSVPQRPGGAPQRPAASAGTPFSPSGPSAAPSAGGAGQAGGGYGDLDDLEGLFDGLQ